MQNFDLCVIGGGVNGAAVARDAAGRGLKVMLAERDDFAQATSSSSSKLAHGGLRYLEHMEFGLVREALKEREVLLKTAPHLVFPMRFLVPLTSAQNRAGWMIWAGLKLYDLMAGRRSLAPSGRLASELVEALPRLRKDNLKSIMQYSDCWVDDARLVLSLLLDARVRGADIANRRLVETVTPTGNGYIVSYAQDGRRNNVRARFIVNAGGPWVNDVLDVVEDRLPRRGLRLVRGSHIVLKMPDPADQTAFTLQNTDGRVVFTIPWLNGKYVVIGTTDAPHEGDPDDVACTPHEREYLLECYNRYFSHPGGPASEKHVVWDWSGVRSLVDDGHTDPARVTRSSRVFIKRQGTGGFVTLYGGKLTTHRRLAEKVLHRLQRAGVQMSGPWTADTAVYGGSLDRDALITLANNGPATLAADLRRRWVFTYGDKTGQLFEHIRTLKGPVRFVAAGVPEFELQYSRDTENARTPDDFLIRRTKLFMQLTDEERTKISNWFQKNVA